MAMVGLLAMAMMCWTTTTALAVLVLVLVLVLELVLVLVLVLVVQARRTFLTPTTRSTLSPMTDRLKRHASTSRARVVHPVGVSTAAAAIVNAGSPAPATPSMWTMQQHQ